ncbi:TM2 domain-containing protein [Clostridium tertium]|uniref:TM2 domain-containing protein n=2 Tax=Clostridium TaxID=1485 RepID=UPI00241FA71A|nr:NINE protein [Clostridium tertium]
MAAFLAIFFGMFGAQKFYLGKYKIGIIYLILSFTGIIGIIELISFLEGLIYLFTQEEEFVEKYL